MRISDEDVEKVITELQDEDEQALANAIVSILKLEFNNRQFLRKIWKHLQDNTYTQTWTSCNLQTDPLNLNDGDVLIGGAE
jgi:hypothetical protein